MRSGQQQGDEEAGTARPLLAGRRRRRASVSASASAASSGASRSPSPPLLFTHPWDEDDGDDDALVALAVTGPVGITGLAPLQAKAPPRQNDRAEVRRASKQTSDADAARAPRDVQTSVVRQCGDASHPPLAQSPVGRQRRQAHGSLISRFSTFARARQTVSQLSDARKREAIAGRCRASAARPKQGLAALASCALLALVPEPQALLSLSLPLRAPRRRRGGRTSFVRVPPSRPSLAPRERRTRGWRPAIPSPCRPSPGRCRRAPTVPTAPPPRTGARPAVSASAAPTAAAAAASSSSSPRPGGRL